MNNEHYQGQISAEHDAQTDINKFLWLVVGFFATVIGILIAIIYQPTPPATRLLEKSQEYTAYYTDAYKAKARGIQLTYAIIGSVLPFALIFLLLLTQVATM